MRAIKIDSISKTVSEVEIDEENSLAGMQAIVDGLIEQALELENGDALFVNEEGLLLGPKWFFEIEGGHQPYAGNGVIVGTNYSTGDSIDAETPINKIKSMVKFLSLDEVRRKYRH